MSLSSLSAFLAKDENRPLILASIATPSILLLLFGFGLVFEWFVKGIINFFFATLGNAFLLLSNSSVTHSVSAEVESFWITIIFLMVICLWLLAVWCLWKCRRVLFYTVIAGYTLFWAHYEWRHGERKEAARLITHCDSYTDPGDLDFADPPPAANDEDDEWVEDIERVACDFDGVAEPAVQKKEVKPITPDPVIRVGRVRVGRHQRRQAAARAAFHVKARKGLLARNPANTLMITRLASDYMRHDIKMRERHVAQIMPLVIELAYLPLASDIEAAEIRRSNQFARRRLNFHRMSEDKHPWDEFLLPIHRDPAVGEEGL